MSYKHINTYERGYIEALYKLGYSTRTIASKLGRHHSSIARELKRNAAFSYEAKKAQETYELRRTKSKPKGKYTLEIAQVIEEGLAKTWSPEQIANTITLGIVSYKTIYTWLYQGKLNKGNLAVLRQKGKRRKPTEKRGKFVVGTPISQRPKEVNNRKSKGCLATFVERKCRLYTAIKIPDRTASSMEQAINQLYAALPAGAFKTATTDRGKEFACYESIKQNLNLTLYFADPYSSWQRGSNENSNGLLREFYPKKTDLALVDEKQLIHNLFLINSRPRKCLGVFRMEITHSSFST